MTLFAEEIPEAVVKPLKIVNYMTKKLALGAKEFGRLIYSIIMLVNLINAGYHRQERTMETIAERNKRELWAQGLDENLVNHIRTLSRYYRDATKESLSSSNIFYSIPYSQ